MGREETSLKAIVFPNNKLWSSIDILCNMLDIHFRRKDTLNIDDFVWSEQTVCCPNGGQEQVENIGGKPSQTVELE